MSTSMLLLLISHEFPAEVLETQKALETCQLDATTESKLGVEN
jgi:hypothetical protein